MSSPLETQYTALTQTRLHFSRLYWLSVAFTLAAFATAPFILGTLAIRPLLLVVLLRVAILWMGAFIAWRLYRLEMQYEQLLGAIERHWQAGSIPGIQIAPVSSGRGSRLLTVLALVGLGLVFAVFSFATTVPIR